MRLLPLLAFLLAGCVHAAAPPLSWHALKPIDYTIDASMSEDCKAAALEAYAFWSQYTDRLSPRERVGGFDGDYPADFGEITVSERVLPQGVAGSTYRVHNGRGQLRAASTFLAPFACADGQTAAHELGHALGLGHSDDRHDLMFWIAAGGWHLSDEEIEQVR